MTSGGSVSYFAECPKCGAKMTTAGTTVGGNPDCQHQFGPIGSYKPQPPKKNKIVYPTDAERKWLRIIDQNKTENNEHWGKFDDDVNKLNELQKKGMSQISSMIQTLSSKLDEREKELQDNLNKAFEERKKKIEENMRALEEHKKKNEETKDNAEELLQSDKPETEREKQIVGDCENVINTTPQLKYIPTKLEYTFRTLNKIETAIANFGKLDTMPMDSGERCKFSSKAAASIAPSGRPKPVDLDSVLSLQLKNSTFDQNAKKVKLSFKVAQKGEIPNINVMDHLKVHVFCAEDVDDQKGEDMAPIYEETVDFKTCKPIKNKFELSINHQFQQGLTIAFKLRPKFETPDESKYETAFGKWSREQTIDIPEEDNYCIFYFELQNKSAQVKINDDDAVLTNFDKFKARFLAQYNRILMDEEELVLSTDEGVVTAKSNLIEFATDSYVIRGQIVRKQPPKVEPPPPAAYSPQAMAPQRSVSPKVQRSVSPAPGQPGGGGGGGDDLKENAPKQISTIVVYQETKKRVVLKNAPKKNTYEYTMTQLQEKVRKKLKSKGLTGDFSLETKDGRRITTDNDIINILADYGEELKVIQ